MIPIRRCQRSAHGLQPNEQPDAHAHRGERADGRAAAAAAAHAAQVPRADGGGGGGRERPGHQRAGPGAADDGHAGGRAAAGAEADAGRAPLPPHPHHAPRVGRQDHRHAARDRQCRAPAHARLQGVAQGQGRQLRHIFENMLCHFVGFRAILLMCLSVRLSVILT